jgi:hypothetical protein
VENPKKYLNTDFRLRIVAMKKGRGVCPRCGRVRVVNQGIDELKTAIDEERMKAKRQHFRKTGIYARDVAL